MYRRPYNNNNNNNNDNGNITDWQQLAPHAFVAVQLDGMVPGADDLEKRGRFGKRLAQHRPRIICVLAVLLFCAGIALSVGFCWLVAQSLRVRAPGIDLHAATRTERDERTTQLADGTLVVNVLEPVKEIDDVSQAVLLLLEPRFVPHTPLTPVEVARGYLEWSPVADHAPFNWTVAYTERLMAAHALATDETCLCYAAFGLPYNAVYVPALGAALYEPRVVKEYSQRVVTIDAQCALHNYLTLARERLSVGGGGGEDDRRPSEQHQHGTLQRSNASGVVEYIGADGSKRRETLDLPAFPCVKHCLGFFAPSTQPMAAE